MAQRYPAGKRLRALFFTLIGSIVFFLTVYETASAEKEYFLDMGIGGGTSLNGIDTAHLLFSPALILPLKIGNKLQVRLEGDIEIIDDDGKITTLTGVSPFLRATWPAGGLKPFIEIGPGVNFSSRQKIAGRNMGGSFLFSAMGGIGLEFLLCDRPVSLSYRLRHLSNGHLYEGNQGLNSQFLFFTVRL